MGTTINEVYHGGARARKESALKRLVFQIKENKKTLKSGESIELSDTDKRRIYNEIDNLNAKLKY